MRRHYVVLYPDRVSAARSQLLEVAALIEQAREVDPECIAELRRLLTSGCDSPLYNREIHPSEMTTALYFLRSRLRDAADAPPPDSYPS